MKKTPRKTSYFSKNVETFSAVRATNAAQKDWTKCISYIIQKYIFLRIIYYFLGLKHRVGLGHLLNWQLWTGLQNTVLGSFHCISCGINTNWPEPIYNPITAMEFLAMFTFSWTTLRRKHCWHSIAIMWVVDTFELGLAISSFELWQYQKCWVTYSVSYLVFSQQLIQWKEH